MEAPKYEFTVLPSPGKKDRYTVVVNTALYPDGKVHLLHNELSLDFTYKPGEPIRITWGWHVGTEDFEFFDKTDNYEDILYYCNYYNPGFLEQLQARMDAGDYEKEL